jgi:hypothetical protein
VNLSSLGGNHPISDSPHLRIAQIAECEPASALRTMYFGLSPDTLAVWTRSSEAGLIRGVISIGEVSERGCEPTFL